MGMPNDMLLVRHGDSELNAANRLSRNGDHSAFTPEFKARHSSDLLLTDRGLWQPTKAGAWIKVNVGLYFDRYVVSDYYRSRQTAALLELPDAQWFSEVYLRERDRGDMDIVSELERQTDYAEAMKMLNRSKFFTRPPNGESMADLLLRVDRVLDTLCRECDGKKVIIVCHGEVMWAFRVRMEHMSRERFEELDRSDNPFDRIYNCQILHYTRIDPETGKQSKYCDWFRSVCPTDLSLSRNEWEKIERRTFTNEQLLASVDVNQRMVNEEVV